ncbi:MAG: GNAT family N-acetyltransferase [Lepagella sp.]
MTEVCKWMEGDRIYLRRWEREDAPVLYYLASDPEVGPSAGWPAHQTVEESLEVIERIFSNNRTWAIVLRSIGEPIGCIGYYTHKTSNIHIGERDCEVGYWIGREYWNRGLCTEALRLLLGYCREVKGYEIAWADHFIRNKASGRVMEKCGFVDTGELNRCSHLLGGNQELVRVYRKELR